MFVSYGLYTIYLTYITLSIDYMLDVVCYQKYATLSYVQLTYFWQLFGNVSSNKHGL